MARISDKAAGGLENRYKYNGIELDTSLGLDEYEATLRDLDPQTGRWWQVDPETEDQEMWSPYTSNNDNPILYKDPRGNEGEACCGVVVQLGEDAVDIYRAVRGGENILNATKGNSITWKTVVNGIFKALEGPEDLIKVNPKDLPANKGKTVELTLPPDTYEIILPADTKVNTSKLKTGSYTNTHKSGKKYHGKGSKARAVESGKRIAKIHDDPLVSTDHTESKNDREAYKDESRRLENDGTYKSDNNYNQRDSPGTNYRKQDGDK